jgi:hypothetical protein
VDKRVHFSSSRCPLHLQPLRLTLAHTLCLPTLVGRTSLNLFTFLAHYVVSECEEWMEPHEPFVALQAPPPTPKLQIDLSSCVTLAVCSLSPPPCLFFDKDQMLFFTSLGLCLSGRALSGLLGKSTKNSQHLPAPAPTQPPPPAFRLRVQPGLPWLHLCGEAGKSLLPKNPSLPSSVLSGPRF